MARTTAETPASSDGIRAVARFGLSVIVLSVIFSALVLPWIDLSWWKVFRRCVSVAAAAALWWCIVVRERRTLRDYGLGPLRDGARHLRFGLMLGLAALAVLALTGLASGSYVISVSPDRAKLWRTVLGFIPAAGVVALLEELVFRGYLLRHLLAWSKTAAVVATSALYSLVHIKSPSWNLMSGMELAGLCLLGAVLALSALLTRQLYVAIGLHAALAYGARVNKVLIAVNDTSTDWLVGTSRLINGVASWIALLVVAAIIMRWSGSLQRGGGTA